MKKIGYIIENSGKDFTLGFKVFYVMQSVCGKITKLGVTNNIERRRAELSQQYQIEFAVIYDGTPASKRAPKTKAVKIERMGKNLLTRLGFNGYLTDRHGEDGFEFIENVPNEKLASLICQAEHAASKSIEYQQFAKFAPRQRTIDVVLNAIKLVQKVAQEAGRMYYGVAQWGGTSGKARLNKKYGGQPKDWNGDTGRKVAIRSGRIHVRFQAQHPVTVCKRKRASVETALASLN
jgi:hypothetical protein